MERRSWDPLATALSGRGVHVLVPDYRGAGENRAMSPDYQKRAGDLDAALAWLRRQPGVDSGRLAAGGASCGVDHAVQLARRDGRLRALVLVSGPTTADGMAYLQASAIPVFLAFSADEGGPFPEMKTALGRSRNTATTIREIG